MAATKDAIDTALERGHTIDITTSGRQTRQPRRIEIVFHNIGGRVYISGTPSRHRRGWLANLEADPHMTSHLTGTVKDDVPATACIIEREAVRCGALPHVGRS